MSLVHDALEKAKREAAAKSARELGLAESRVGAGQPFRARRRIHPVAAAAVAAAVTLGLVGALLFWSGSATKAPDVPGAPTPSAPPAVAQPAVAEPAADDGSPVPAPATAAPSLDAASPIVEEPVAKPPAPATETASSVPESTRAPDPAPTRAAAPAAPSPAASAPASFVRQTTLADGTVVKLGGIAWSEAAPLAYLNGRLYARGESVAGLLIERIERERVVLAGGSGRIVLTLK